MVAPVESVLGEGVGVPSCETGLRVNEAALCEETLLGSATGFVYGLKTDAEAFVGV